MHEDVVPPSALGEPVAVRHAASPRSAALPTLVRAATSGDAAAFAEIYARFHRAVHAVVLARGRREEAADLVQEVFVTAYEKLATLEDPAAFPGWLLTLARNRATDSLRRVRPVKELGDYRVEPPPRAEAREALDAIAALPEAYRETLLMRLVEGMSGPEIAERTGLAEGSVRVNLHRGMALLRERLAGRTAEGDGR